MAYYKVPYDPKIFGGYVGKPPAGAVIRRDIPILESKAVNERRKVEREAAGITSQKQESFVLGDERLQDPAYYKSMDIEQNLGWDEI